MPEVEMKEEAPDAHFTVDKQNISLWPREPPPKQDPVLRKPLCICVAFSCLAVVLVAFIVLQAVFYPRLMGKILDVKSDAQMLKGRVDNISTLGSDLKTERGRVDGTEAQMRIVNASLNRVRSQILYLETSMKLTQEQLQLLTTSWGEVDNLNAKIPELQRDLDQASALNGKVRGLQYSLEKVNKLLKGQSDILEMVAQGWRYFEGNFYYFSRITKTWYSAEQFCVSREAHLTSVSSESEQEFLYKAAGGIPHWIGLTKAGSEGDWNWVDQTPFNKEQSKRFWIPGEPNNAGNNEHCANLRVYALKCWNDSSCDNTFLFICKRPYIQTIQ